MKKPKFNKKIILFIAIGIFAFLIWQQQSKLICASGDSYLGCEKNSATKNLCIDGKWEKERIAECGNKTCLEGVCVEKECSGNEIKNTCQSTWKNIIQKCENGLFKNDYEICEQKEYCKEGIGCVSSPESCDNGICEKEKGENETTCLRDCGSLSSWDLYYSSIPTDIKKEYLNCGAEFDCNNPIISEAIVEMERKYQPKNPREWIESASKYVYSLMDYSFGGGLQQCNTKASDLFKEAFTSLRNKFSGNCVDVSTMYIAMARKKGIPSYHAGLCLSNLQNWNCKIFAFVQPYKQLPYPLGRIDGKLESTGGNVYGHAVAMSFGLYGKFYVVDPTMQGVGLSKECFGYSPVLSSGISEQVCYINNWQNINYCQGF